MAFTRPALLGDRPDDSKLTADMVGIGMNFAAPANLNAQLEETLVHASAQGMDDHDFRVLSVLTTWLGAHHHYVNADRLVRCVSEHPSLRVRAYWSAVATWLGKDRRLARLRKLYDGAAVALLPVGTDFQIARRGADKRFLGTGLRVPAGTLREREADVLTPAELARHHAGYRNRVRLGPTWRADVWTELERAPHAPVANIAKRAGCSFATAWKVAQDFALLHSSKDEARSEHDAAPPQR